MRRYFSALLLILTITLIRHSHATPNIEGWQAYQTDHFVLYSTKPKASVEKMLYEFEVFRASVYEALQLNTQKKVLPVEIYIIDDPTDFAYFAKKYVGGYFQDTVYGPKMVIGPQELDGLSRQTILYHEYVHYLMRTLSGFRYPTWYNEGIAEYYSTLEIKDDHVVVGKGTIRKSLNRGSIPGIDAVLNRQGTHSISGWRQRDEYYASAWLLVNFFSLSAVNGFPDYRGELSQYLTAFNQGADHDTAFSDSFNITINELKTQLKKYSRNKRLNLARLPLPDIAVNIAGRPIKPAYMSREFAYLAGVRSDVGIELMNQAINLGDGDAMAYMADHLAETKPEKALQWIDKATLSGSLTAEGATSFALAYAKLAKESSSNADALLNQSKLHFEKALATGELPQIHYFYPDVLWALGFHQEAINHVVTSIKIMPANLYVNLQAGDYMIRIKNYLYARRFLENVKNWSESSEFAGKAQRLLDSIPQPQSN